MTARPAARVGDLHFCPSHGFGPIAAPGCLKVLIAGAPAARGGDFAFCPDATPDVIIGSISSVQIGGKAAARMLCQCAHGGNVLTGTPKVLIGDPTSDGKATRPKECAFLDNWESATGKGLARLRDKYDMENKGVEYVSPDGEDPPIPMYHYVCTIRGKQVNIYSSEACGPNGWSPSADQMAQGMATCSDQQLANVNNVYVMPHSRSDGANAAADCGGGNIRYFPRTEEHPQSDIDWVCQHETGHAMSIGGDWNDSSQRTAWDQAIAADASGVTDYGNTSDKEDYAEFMLLYSMVIGTPCEAAARAMYPNRFAYMDKKFPQGRKVTNPSAANAPY